MQLEPLHSELMPRCPCVHLVSSHFVLFYLVRTKLKSTMKVTPSCFLLSLSTRFLEHAGGNADSTLGSAAAQFASALLPTQHYSHVTCSRKQPCLRSQMRSPLVTEIAANAGLTQSGTSNLKNILSTVHGPSLASDILLAPRFRWSFPDAQGNIYAPLVSYAGDATELLMSSQRYRLQYM